MQATMNDKVVLITGGSGGIGRQTAIGLAKLGARVVVTGRDPARGVAGVAEIVRASGNSAVELLLADLSRQDEVRGLARSFKARYGRLDVLINNLGTLERRRELTADGVERHFAINVLTPFVLTHALLDILGASRPSRVINVTGGMPQRVQLDNLQAERSFQSMMTYSHSKTLMHAMSIEFAARLAGSGITLNVCYPGGARTAMTGGMTADMLPAPMRLLSPLFSLMMREDGGKSAAKAARSSIYLASSPEVADVHGAYYNTASRRRPFSPRAVYDPQVRRVIWELCEQLAQSSDTVAAAEAFVAA